MNTSGLFALLIGILLLSAGALAWYRAEGEPPVFEAPEALVVGRAGKSLSLEARDGESGLRAVRVWVRHGDQEQVLLDERYPGNLLSGGVRRSHTAEIALDPANLAEVLGDAQLNISVRDWSWRGGFGGNETLREIPLRIDTDPPQISVRSGLTYVRQGGSASVAYHLSEPTHRDGVQVGEHFYQGYPRPGGGQGERVALFAAPLGGDAEAKVRVIAVDDADNSSEASWPVVIQRHPQPTGRVRLSNRFLETVVPRLAPEGGSDPAAAFHGINTELRAKNEATIRTFTSASAGDRYFGSSMKQLAGSKVTSRFGERRTYEVNGRGISEAVHYGYDLASFAAAPINAATAGVVLHADDLGIYGNCVIVDHGLGLTTLYGHLSRIDVEAGQKVESGERLGLSGATGLAGGDHLHFAVLVGDTYVDPLEWWDPKWVASHIDENLGVARP